MMKNAFTLLMLLAALAVCGMAAADTAVIRNAAPLARIYHAPLTQDAVWPGFRPLGKLTPAEMDTKALAMSIADLNYHFRAMSGTELEVVVTADPRAVKAPAIVIGELANKMGALPTIEDDPSKEAFRIRAKDGLLLIGGAGDFGSSHGIYALLERLGCFWAMPGKEGEIIPQLKTVTIPDMDIEEAPSFGRRTPWYGGQPTAQEWQELHMWGLRQKCSLHGTQPRYGFDGGGHAWGFIIRRFKDEFDKNPEMMGLIRKPDGSMVRGGGQLESTHPRVIELAIEYIRERFKENKWPNDANVCIGMGPNDGGALSLSPETMNAGVSRLNYDSGKEDGTDIIVLFLNTLLERTEKEFPNLHLGFLVYSWHADYPMRYKPHPRVVAGIADINFSRFHGASDEASRSRAYYKDVLLQWGKLHKEQGNQLTHGNYNWNLADAVMPYTKVKIYGEDFPLRKEVGISVVGMNLSQDWYLTAPHSYVLVKMAWDTKNDWKKLLREYCDKAFGKRAAPFVESYYLELARRQSQSSQEAGAIYSIPLIYDKAFVAAQNKNFDAALKAAGTPDEKRRVGEARYPLQTLAHYLDMREAYAAFDFAAARRHFDMANAVLEEVTGRNIHNTNKQGKGYFNGFRRFLEAADKYSSSEYKIEYEIPNRLKTAIDVNNLGGNNRFWGSKLDDSNYLTTETFMSTWDAQGLSGLRTGSVWYRVHFKLNKTAAKAGGYGLFLGGADNYAAVWCNDKFIARTSAGLRTPTLFDITDAVRPGEDNLLAIQVTRNGNWELFTGGIMMPCFVFSGPRVEQPKDTEPPFRMLPGGVIEAIK